jgi:hypothetical protein
MEGAMSAPSRGAVIGEVAGRFLRIAVCALLVLLAAGIVLEAALRLGGARPQNIYGMGFSPTVIDRWTEWAMRSEVRLNEYAVTNAYGMHEDREVNLARVPGVPRVAVLGSSVTWGLGEPLENTIPRSAQRALEKSGCPAEVLNFAGQGYNILNASAYLETKVHQFQPDAAVIMMDLQMAFPRFPRPNPITDEQAVVRRLGFFEGLFKRMTQYSVVLTALDDVSMPKVILRRLFPFPVEVGNRVDRPPQAYEQKGRRQVDAILAWAEGGASKLFDLLKTPDMRQAVAVAPAPPLPAAKPAKPSIEEYEARRRRELGAVVASMSVFAREMGIRLYFVTPYGPYFHTSPDQLAKFSLNMLQEAVPIYGSLEAVLRREAELSSDIIRQAATANGASVIDMFPSTREATMARGDFSNDGIHFSAQGYHNVGAIIAARLRKDGLCSPAFPLK